MYSEARCVECGAPYRCIEGIWRMLTTEQREQYRSFLQGYPALRQREGWEREEAYYLALPDVPPGDPTAFVWSIRRRSLSVLDQLLAKEANESVDRWALDLGAGNGWLARHLSRRGYRVIALDLTLGGLDSLSGARLYIEHDNTWLGRVQASMSRLPLANSAFSLCTISAALHYADTEQTLREVYRVLAPDGLLVISDSPVYGSAQAGAAMAAEREARIAALLPGGSPRLPGGQNFLVETELLEQMQHIGFGTQVIPIERTLGSLKRSLLRAIKPGRREEARFPVIVGRKRRA